MATSRKAKATSRSSSKTHRIKIEVPADADQAVVKALRAAAGALAGAEVEEHKGAPHNSYSLTVHTYPDNAGEG